MNKDEFLARLSDELLDVQDSDRIDALNYYSEYIDDSGCTDAVALLGPPASVAAQVKANAAIKRLEQGQSSTKKSVKAVWISLIAIFSAPIALPLAISAFALCLALLLVIIVTIIAVAIIIIAFGASGLFCFGMSFVTMMGDFFSGLALGGIGLVLMGVSVLTAIPAFTFIRYLCKELAIGINKLILRRSKK